MERKLFVAFEHYDTHVGAQLATFKRLLPEEPGLSHAVDVEGTHERSQWFRASRQLPRREPIFYSEFVPLAACGRGVRVAIPIEFTAEVDDACLECADVVAAGGGFRPRPRYRSVCDDVIRIEGQRGFSVYSCVGRLLHDGPHKSIDGATWESTADTFTPAPDGWV